MGINWRNHDDIRKGIRNGYGRKNKKKNRRRGSIFRKLIGSYIIFGLIAILITIIVTMVSLIVSMGGSMISDFPGLTIAKAVMEKHGGSISYEERDGRNVFELRIGSYKST